MNAVSLIVVDTGLGSLQSSVSFVVDRFPWFIVFDNEDYWKVRPNRLRKQVLTLVHTVAICTLCCSFSSLSLLSLSRSRSLSLSFSLSLLSSLSRFLSLSFSLSDSYKPLNPLHQTRKTFIGTPPLYLYYFTILSVFVSSNGLHPHPSPSN